MKLVIVQFDSRPLDQLGLMPLLLHRNGVYAAKHGYGYHFLNAHQADLPPFWQKPLICQRMLESGYDAVCWLDTDAVVHDLDRRLEELFLGSEAMIAAPDNPHWGTPFNAGVFLARGAAGAKLMARWSSLFAGTKWTRTPTASVCEDEWAGPSYEQGAFRVHLLDELTASGELRLEDWQTLQSPFPIPGALTLHYAGVFKANLPTYLETI
ncbi:MAG TPA: hypothetical protein VIO94_12330 [Phenylobacterium sp.]